MKICAVTALLLVLVGLGLAAAGGALSNAVQIRDVVDKVTGGRIQLNLTGLGDGYGMDSTGKSQSGRKEIFDQLGGEAYYDMDDASMFDKEHTIVNGDVQETFAAGNVRSLDVEVGGCSFTLEESPDENFHVDTVGTNKVQCYVEKDTLYVKATVKTLVGTNEASSVVLYVPADAVVEGLDLEVGAGIMNLGHVKAGHVDLEVGAGQILVESILANELDISVGMGAAHLYGMDVTELNAGVGMGNLYATGSVNGNSELECSMGNITLELSGAAEAFDYDIECGMGKVSIGEESYSGLINEKILYNGAGRHMDVECGAGNVEILFAE